MIADGAEAAGVEPPALVAVTMARSVWFTSPATRMCVAAVAPAMREQLLPEVSQSIHWWANEVGPPVQAPLLVDRVWPWVVVPLMTGGVEFAGGAGVPTTAF